MVMERYLFRLFTSVVRLYSDRVSAFSKSPCN